MQNPEQNKVSENVGSGTYEIIRKRLQSQRDELITRLNQLNDARRMFSRPTISLYLPTNVLTRIIIVLPEV